MNNRAPTVEVMLLVAAPSLYFYNCKYMEQSWSSQFRAGTRKESMVIKGS